MAITTWLNYNEKETFKQVHDRELNELFQEIRESVSDKYYVQQHVSYKRKHWLLGGVITLWSYTLYIDNEYEAQIYNFPPPSNAKSSINTGCDKAQLMTFFFGVLAGFRQKNQ